MVLSNKKLKQKLRAAKAELLAPNPNQESFKKEPSLQNGLKEQEEKEKPMNKRKNKRKRSNNKDKKSAENGEVKGNVNSAEREENGDFSKRVNANAPSLHDEQKDQEEKEADLNDEKQSIKKKRKRDEGEVLEKEKAEKKPMKKRKKKKKKKKSNSKEKQRAENGDIKENVNMGSGGNAEGEVLEPSKSMEREENGDFSRRVYVGGIPYYSTEDDIRSYFEGCGTITEVDCMNFPDSGKFRGIAIVSFKTEAAAKRALAMDGSDMGGLFLKIQSYKSARANKVSNFSPDMVKGYNRVYVGSLSWDVTEDDLKKLFSDCSVSSIRFGEDKETGEFRGYAHVDFADSTSVSTALKLDQRMVCGRPVRISCAVAKKGAVKKGEVTNSRPLQKDQNVDSVATNAVSAKIRRRTCYECGEKGHLSSSCPKKQESEQAAN